MRALEFITIRGFVRLEDFFFLCIQWIQVLRASLKLNYCCNSGCVYMYMCAHIYVYMYTCVHVYVCVHASNWKHAQKMKTCTKIKTCLKSNNKKNETKLNTLSTKNISQQLCPLFPNFIQFSIWIRFFAIKPQTYLLICVRLIIY